MKNRISCTMAIASSLLLATTAFAQTPKPAPAVELFAQQAAVRGLSLSPNGQYLAIGVPTANNDETQLQIVPLNGSQGSQLLRFGRQFHVSDILWSSDERLVLSKADMEPMKAQPFSMGELFTTDIAGKDQEMLFGWVEDKGNVRGRRKDKGFAYVSQVLDNHPGEVQVAFRCWNCGEEPDTALFNVDTRTGERKEIDRLPGYNSFLSDHNGVPRVAVGYDENDNPLIKYRPTAESKWQALPESIAGYSLGPWRIEPDNNTLYATVSDEGEPTKFYRIDLKAGTRTLLSSRADVSVGDVMWKGRTGGPFAVVYNSAKPFIDYIDKGSDWTQMHAGLMKQFAGQIVEFDQFTVDDKKVLFHTYSDRNPSSYYVLDREKMGLQLVSELQPGVKAEEMAATQSIEFTSRDGKKIFGFYTGQGAENKPLVVMPHGGPYNEYDQWGYDSTVQYLASRGYGVLQVNFRGSGGRGHDFVQDGFREWGGKIQDDIADGVRWATNNKLADPQRVCIFGGSFGGYSALMNPIRNPDLFKCAIGYAGVYDLELMFKAGDIHETMGGKRYLSRVLGDDANELAKFSPARQVDQLKVPVLLLHGSIDQRVPMAQFNSLVSALKSRDRTVETVVISGEGHGFYKPENRVKMFNAMTKFLDKHIGPQAKP